MSGSSNPMHGPYCMTGTQDFAFLRMLSAVVLVAKIESIVPVEGQEG
jgi:hypothetical protein